MNNYLLSNLDTDSFMICKPDMSSWTKEERILFNTQLNKQFPDLISWADDGYYPQVVIVKSKNYVLVDEKGKVKIKGSALKDQKKAKIFLEFIGKFIDLILADKQDQLVNLYHEYVLKTVNITDITPFAKKVTITDKITKCKGHTELTPEEKKEKKLRKNETNVYDALKGRQVQEGDKIYVFFDTKDTLSMVQDFNGTYDRKALLNNLHKCCKIFKNVVPFEQFLNYTLKKNKKLLEELNVNS